MPRTTTILVQAQQPPRPIPSRSPQGPPAAQRGPTGLFNELPPSLRHGTEFLPRSEAHVRSTTDAGSLLGESPATVGIEATRRTPIITDTRVRGIVLSYRRFVQRILLATP